MSNKNKNFNDGGNNSIDADTATDDSDAGASDDISDIHQNESQLPSSQKWTDTDLDEHSACTDSNSRLGTVNDENNGISVPSVSINEKNKNTLDDVNDEKKRCFGCNGFNK